MKKIIAILPARYNSSRFPGKPLALIHGKPMIQWVYERVSSVQEIDEVYVATDDERIFNKVLEFEGKVIMTSSNHPSGTDRIAEAINKENIDAEIVLNIQGDEPMIDPRMIRTLISSFNDETVYASTLKKKLFKEDEIKNPNIAKVITDLNDYAIYFSRSTIPYNRDNATDISYFKHIGVYGYKRDFLEKFTNLHKSKLEQYEQLEQLRILENGYKLKVLETEHQSIGVDLPEHIEIVEKEMINMGILI